MLHRKPLLVAFCMIVLTACADPSAGESEAAQENCRRLIYNYCLTASSCSLFQSQADCETEARQVLDCSLAVYADPDRIETCFSDIEAISCGGGAELPASCSGVIETEGR